MVAPGKILDKAALRARCFINCNEYAPNTFKFVCKKKETGDGSAFNGLAQISLARGGLHDVFDIILEADRRWKSTIRETNEMRCLLRTECRNMSHCSSMEYSTFLVGGMLFL